MTRRTALRSSAILLLLASGCGATVGYPLRPETIRTGRMQPLRLAIATLEDARPEVEQDWGERLRLVGEDEARGYTDDYNFRGGPIAEEISDLLVRHLTFANCFREVARVPEIYSDQPVEYLKRDIKKLSGTYDAVLIGKVTHFYGFDGYNAEGDRRIVESKVQLADLKIIRTRDLKLIWAGEAVANVGPELESTRKGNQYRIANDTLREALNQLVQKLGKTRLSAR